MRQHLNKISVLFAAALTAAGMAPAAWGASKIAADALSYNYGTVDETVPVEHTFTLRNEGDSPLEIYKVETSCGCTATQIGGNQVKPGQSTALTAKINLRGRRGRQEKSITVSSNDPSQPVLTLRMEGTVVAEIDVSPTRVDFLDVKNDQVAERIVTVTTPSGPPFRITGIDTTAATFVTVRSVALEEGKSYQLKVQTTPPFSPGVNRGTVAFKTDNPKYQTIYLPVSLSVSSDLVVVPNGVMLPYSPGSNPPASATLLLRSRSGRAFKIIRVDPPRPGITTKVLPEGPASWKLEVGNIVPDPGLNGTFLRVFTEGIGIPPETRIPLQIYNRTPAAAPKFSAPIFK